MKSETREIKPSPPAGTSDPGGRRKRGFLLAGAVLLAFGRPLYDLACFAAQSELYSYILLVPFISLYLAWLKRGQLAPPAGPAPHLAVLPLAGGLIALGGYWYFSAAGMEVATEDVLALASVGFALTVLGVCGLCLGPRAVRGLAFPLTFLVFLAPVPVLLMERIEAFLQQGSAAVALGFFKVAGTTLFYHDLVFQLPGISIAVAPECSGIHSSIVLFITSLLAGHLFLRTRWKRGLLAAAVVPLALLRNGFRVFTIGELCVHYGPDMINSYIHRKGGPVFFVLSLVPFILLLALLVRSDRRTAGGQPPALGVQI